MSELVNLDISEDIATITMDDGKANAFGPPMISAMSGAFDEAANSKAIVLTGRAGVFCAGFDLKTMREGPEAAAAMVKSGAEFLLRFYLQPQPTVIACTGHGIAAGALLLLCADYRFGQAGDSNIGLNETSIGMTLPNFGVELARDRLLPTAHAEAVLGAKIYGMRGAMDAGYLDDVVEEADLLEAAIAKAKQLATLDPRAYAGTKINLRRATADRIRPTIDAGIRL
jgi:enoyl-CoA hydratase